MTNRIWFITGISSGLGKALAQTVIERGDFVIGTFRHDAQAVAFTEENKGKAVGITLDITQKDQVEMAFNFVNETYRKIDVLVNNAGYGFAGAIEETSMEEARAVFEANFFGTMQVTQIFLPFMRAQQSGHIIQMSSHGGIKAFPGFGIYNACKFALEGFSEALALELAPLNIKLSLIEPGPFRTNFAGSSFKQADKVIDAYHGTAGVFRERMNLVNGKQEGDPLKAAKAIYEITKLKEPPLRLPLGKIAVASITTKLASVKNDLDNFKEIAENAVFE